jgi:hypothetical protein
VTEDSEVVAALLRGHWYDAVAALLDGERLADPSLSQAHKLAVAGKRVLDLDAEDFGDIAKGFKGRPWAKHLASACFPLTPRDLERGALESLIPLYELMLEVLNIRSQRHEPLQVVVTAHLIGEYLPQLAWERVFGHAGDPLLMSGSVGERWGSDAQECPHGSAARATARRALNACNGDVAGYTAYLDRFHSRLGPTLAVCAMNHTTVKAGERPDVGDTCPNPCRWALRGTLTQRRDLDARVRLALLYRDSAIVSLRHHAPVGHFFGVPSVGEISEAWLRTWDRVSQQWPDGSNPLLEAPWDVSASDEALPGMSALVSAVAGQPITAGTLIDDIGQDVADSLSLPL